MQQKYLLNILKLKLQTTNHLLKKYIYRVKCVDIISLVVVQKKIKIKIQAFTEVHPS